MEKKPVKKVNKKLSRIEISPKYPAIMEKYESVGVFMTMREFYDEYVSKIDYNITITMWYRFMNKYNRKIQIKTDELVKRAADKKVTETQLEESSVKKLLAIADVTLDHVIKNPELLNSVPLADRMSWLFSSMKARDSRMIAVAKIQAEKRKTNVFEDMLKAAQYGAIDPDEIKSKEIAPETAVEGEFEETIPQEKEPVAVKTQTIEFSPADLE